MFTLLSDSWYYCHQVFMASRTFSSLVWHVEREDGKLFQKLLSQDYDDTHEDQLYRRVRTQKRKVCHDRVKVISHGEKHVTDSITMTDPPMHLFFFLYILFGGKVLRKAVNDTTGTSWLSQPRLILRTLHTTLLRVVNWDSQEGPEDQLSTYIFLDRQIHIPTL